MIKKKISKFQISRWIILVFLLLGIGLIRIFPHWGEWYARTIYPSISAFLSLFSVIMPFSLGDFFIVIAILTMVGSVCYALWRRNLTWKIFRRLLEWTAWIYVWFYLAWGMNYFREDFYTRSGIERVAYVPENFHAFLETYLSDLNSAYEAIGDTVTLFTPRLDLQEVSSEISHGFDEIHAFFGMISPQSNMRPKYMLSSSLMSKMAVLGYMGPFFSEFNLNAELPAIQYPSCYAHELAHRLGIAGESEANLYAYLVCVRSSVPVIRFSGYFSLLGYVMGNARRLLSEAEFKELSGRLNPAIRELYREEKLYWYLRYSTWIGSIQAYLYNLFLKGNNVQGGIKNYSEVVGLLISYQRYNKELLKIN